MMSFIRLHKTPINKRGTYKIIDEHGRVVSEVSPGRDGVTVVDIYNAHTVDDHEVYKNCKEFRPKFPDWLQKDIDEWKKRECEKFTQDFGRKPMRDEMPQYEHLLSLDGFLAQGENSDNSNILNEELLRQQVSEPPEVAYLREMVAKFPRNWQEIYHSVVVDDIPMTQVAKERGVTEGAVRKIVGKIRKRIAQDDILKKIYHGGTDI